MGCLHSKQRLQGNCKHTIGSRDSFLWASTMPECSKDSLQNSVPIISGPTCLGAPPLPGVLPAAKLLKELPMQIQLWESDPVTQSGFGCQRLVSIVCHNKLTSTTKGLQWRSSCTLSHAFQMRLVQETFPPLNNCAQSHF
ncbi:UNVERIFIED_CONTAM: hypothetical protein K2H54_029002 [Gekko kuhli]